MKRLNDEQRRALRIRDDQCDVVLTSRVPDDSLCLLPVPCKNHGLRPDLVDAAHRRALAEAWFAGYDKGNLDGYFGSRDERKNSPYADLDPYNEEARDDDDA